MPTLPPVKLPNYIIVGRTKTGSRTRFRECMTKKELAKARTYFDSRYAVVRVFKATYKRV